MTETDDSEIRTTITSSPLPRLPGSEVDALLWPSADSSNSIHPLPARVREMADAVTHILALILFMQTHTLTDGGPIQLKRVLNLLS